ncbi:MAG: aminopeptidase [Bilifractor sp.]
MSYRKLTDFEQERFDLALGRIREIAGSRDIFISAPDFFRTEAEFLAKMEELRESLEKGEHRDDSLEALQAENRALYAELLPENYPVCYGNPAYAKSVFGECGDVMSAIYEELRGAVIYACENRPYDMLILMELFLSCFSLFEEAAEASDRGRNPSAPGRPEVRRMLYWYLCDYGPEMTCQRLQETLDPSFSFIRDRIMSEDLSDPRYLYRFGEYVTDNERKTAEFLASMSGEEIRDIARTWTNGYRMGFLVEKKDLSGKKTVNIRYRLGFERVVREAVLQFREMGLESVIYRSASHLQDKSAHGRIGFYGAVPNRQYEFDHKNDSALWLDDSFVTKMLAAKRIAFEEFADLASVHGGPACMDVFGEIPFTPSACADAPALSREQQRLAARLQTETGRITNRYIKGEERSFTIIAYPVPEIGPDFEDIFRETVHINNLDYKTYQTIQQKLIDALDEGEAVHVLGMNGNETDLTIRLHHLDDPAHQTNFENCVADVNIPVGEVFTSPVLTGTSGLLHVKKVCLEEFEYRDLRIRLQDGMVADYSCANFDSEEENRRYIRENILFRHETVPIGEFAIGTNTTAYRMAHDYDIAAKLPILIAEKMGPHFAFGDTCYSFQEDLAVYNPDGKEIIARDNERTLLRKTEPEKAYFGCHTDVTIPYDELGSVAVVRPDGSETKLLERGRFVLPGTEELNRPLEGI